MSHAVTGKTPKHHIAALWASAAMHGVLSEPHVGNQHRVCRSAGADLQYSLEPHRQTIWDKTCNGTQGVQNIPWLAWKNRSGAKKSSSKLSMQSWGFTRRGKTFILTKLDKEIDKLSEKNKEVTEKIASLEATQTTMKLLVSQVSGLARIAKCAKEDATSQQGLLMDERDSSV